MTDDKLRERLLAAKPHANYHANAGLCHTAVAELDRLEAENARKSALLDQLAEALAMLFGSRNRVGSEAWLKGEELSRQALATYRESAREA